MNRREYLEGQAAAHKLTRREKAELLQLREAEHLQTMSNEMRMPEAEPEMEALFDAKPFDTDSEAD